MRRADHRLQVFQPRLVLLELLLLLVLLLGCRGVVYVVLVAFGGTLFSCVNLLAELNGLRLLSTVLWDQHLVEVIGELAPGGPWRVFTFQALNASIRSVAARERTFQIASIIALQLRLHQRLGLRPISVARTGRQLWPRRLCDGQSFLKAVLNSFKVGIINF